MCKNLTKLKNAQAVNEMRTTLTRQNLHEFEIAALANLFPDTLDEAKSLIPSLAKRYSDDEINSILNDLKNYRKFT